MTMPTSGSISIGQARDECGLGNPINAGNATLAKLAGDAQGQLLKWSDWYGKSTGFQVIESNTQFFTVNYTHAMWANFGYSLYVYTTPDVYRASGGSYTNGGTFPNTIINGVHMNGIMRHGTTVTLYSQNSSLDGVTFVTSLGESLTASNDHSFSWAVGSNLYTIYCLTSPLGQGPWTYNFNLVGNPVRAQPPAGYINGVAPPPVAGGGNDGGGGPN